VFGNPYIGGEFVAVADRVMLEAGLRLPVNSVSSESFADVLGALGDPMRMEAFMDNTVPVIVAANYDHRLTPALGVRARAGVVTAIYSGDDAADADATIDYGAAGTYTAGAARFTVGLAGRWFATTDEGGFGENSLHHLGVSMDVWLGGVRPGLTVRVPLDRDYRDLMGSSVGVFLQVPLR
jgi:hypothetical protein